MTNETWGSSNHSGRTHGGIGVPGSSSQRVRQVTHPTSGRSRRQAIWRRSFLGSQRSSWSSRAMRSPVAAASPALRAAATPAFSWRRYVTG